MRRTQPPQCTPSTIRCSVCRSVAGRLHVRRQVDRNLSPGRRELGADGAGHGAT